MAQQGRQPVDSPTFVGRERELGELKAAFDRAVDGQGSLAMVVGEPGIGKTALCEQLASLATEKGGLRLVGHCYEEGSLSMPYLAFVESLRTYVLNREPADLSTDLGPQAGDLARILPEIRDKLGIEPNAPLEPEEDRYRLLQAVSDFLRSISAAQPLLVVLEDLHDADQGTLDMLTYLSRTLDDSNVLIVGTYRDVEVDRTHPLSGTLAELRRVSSFERIGLRGLTSDEVHRMMSGMSDREVSWGIAEAVHRQTEGNPLFVQEVLRYLLEEGRLAGGVGGDSGAAAIAMSIPEGLRDVIGKRLTRMSRDCNELLRIAAVIGRDFSLDILEPVAGVPEDGLFRSLEEAANAGLIEERSSVPAGVTYRFAHAFFRQTLYEETIAPRRVRLHQRVGEAIEKAYPDRLEDHASELADHFTNAPAISDLAKAVAYGEMAARQAQSVYAYGEAVRLLEQALQVQEVVEPDDKARRCDLLLALGEALMPAGEPRKVLDSVAPEAFALAEALADRGRASRASQVALEALTRYGAATVIGSPEAGLWVERADRYAEPGTRERVFADVTMAAVRLGEGNLAEGKALRLGGLELARALDDPESLFFAAAALLSTTPRTPRQEAEVWELALEMMARPHARVTPQTLGHWLQYAAMVSLDFGERARSEELWAQLNELARRTDDAMVGVRSLLARPVFDYIDGRLEEAILAADDLRTRAEEAGGPGMGRLFSWFVSLRPLIYVGRGVEVIATPGGPDSLQFFGRNYGQLMAALSNAHLGLLDEAEGGLRRLMADTPGFIEDENVRTGPLLILLEIAVLITDRELCSVLAPRLTPVAFLSSYRFTQTCPARLLGGAYALLAEPEKARAYYHQALETAGKIRFRPEIALTHLQLAELLLESFPGERAEAVDHLDFAIGELRDMKMQPALERALGLQEKLDSPTGDAVSYPDGLSQREVEVLRLIARGKSNREIAEELFISASTVSHHVTSILNKTVSSNRAEAAIYASRHDLA